MPFGGGWGLFLSAYGPQQQNTKPTKGGFVFTSEGDSIGVFEDETKIKGQARIDAPRNDYHLS